ncbi:hypothetical protein M409DRAFT_62901 [Zasmidium cellare ATCC 36951]|uniref:Uncharacterized protein n=1 Tax=Zasmidium cellare ATCC 36951 TaxID=1080233 RepID=A0A6A6D1X6_ZASCE|nr:uncharacterized protein M409DRAFT_62901 [Zasmidium cellare ATCC 36951]KAF2172089.1 hypothetical protein M409DRAFT_62901 [Zasmidium cellare ATCC 36951]
MTPLPSKSSSSTLPKGLPLELWKLILSYIEPDYEQAIPIDKAIARRQFLSVESFVPPDPRDSLANVGRHSIGRLRLVCRGLAEVGAPFQFTQLVVRFSQKGLRRLDNISQCPHLARLVRRFTYMVPYFFEEGLNNFDEIRDDLRQEGLKNFNKLREKADDQRDILDQHLDVQVLKKAIANFTSLQLVQLLRWTEHEDRIVLDYLKRHEEARRTVNLDWTLACSRAGQTVGIALLNARKTEPNRFILPFASPTSAQFLRQSKPNSVWSLAEKLTCLTLHFDDGEDLEGKLQDLSELFHAIFTKASKMKAVHIGFPPQHPLSLPLEKVFHHVKWDDLIAFGVQGWELEKAEIIGLLERHKDRLKGVRLRDVHLKDGSTWKEILSFMRDEMRMLQWVSLRRIGYTAYSTSQLQQHPGAEVPPFLSDSEEDSEDESEEDEPIPGPSTHVDSDDDSNFDEDSDDEHEPHANDMDFPSFSPDTPASASWCNCSGDDHVGSAEELGDTDIIVSNTKRKHWERWVLRRCPEHGER